MSYIRKLPSGKSQVIKDIAFYTLLGGRIPDKNKSINELIDEFDKLVLKADSSITKDALNNVHGDWYEWLLAIEAWNYCAEHKDAHLPLLTPNITQFDVARIYNDKL